MDNMFTGKSSREKAPLLPKFFFEYKVRMCNVNIRFIDEFGE